MAISADAIYFYAADSVDFDTAVYVAVALGIPGSHVTGYYNQAWAWAESTSNLLIAVGAFATDAMYYNPCGWNNQAAGSSPFNIVGPGPDSQNGGTLVDQLPPNNYSATTVPWFVNAGGDGYLWETMFLAYLLGYYAIYSGFPSWYNGTSIAAHTPTDSCPSGASTPVSCTTNGATQS